MNKQQFVQSITATSPAAASTVIHTALFNGDSIAKADKIVIDAVLAGATGGTLDVYLQRKIASDTWRDFLHFPQLAAGAATVRYTATINGEGTSLVVVGGGSDASPGVALAANTLVNVIPGGNIRIVFVAGASTSAGAAQTIQVTTYGERH